MASAAVKLNSESRIKLVPKEKVKPVKKPKVNSVIGKIEDTFKRENYLAIIWGFMLGGVPPISTYTVAHYAVTPGTPQQLAHQFASYFVLGGLIYSSITVYQWKLIAVQNKWKAFGFVLLTEGVMTFIHIPWLSALALFQLVIINWTSNSYNLMIDKG